jgi:hypothetical protein
MNVRREKIFRLVAMLSAGYVLFSPLHAQETANPAGVTLPRSPVESFRELLALTPNERKKAVAERPPETQKLILAKVREYLSLKPDEREMRLRATELRWYLLPLMNIPPTNRAAQLALIPPEQRKLIEDRLAQWDRVAPATQRELLENELTARYFTQFEMSTPQQRTNLLAEISPRRRAQLEAGMARWGALSEEQRRKTCERFDQFFELTPREKEKALNTLSEAERQQMEKTLRTFENLPKAERELCVRSFEKFASLSLEERQQFLKNAERWRLMSADERQAWRDLVTMVPGWPALAAPPMPPGFPTPVATNMN